MPPLYLIQDRKPSSLARETQSDDDCVQPRAWHARVIERWRAAHERGEDALSLSADYAALIDRFIKRVIKRCAASHGLERGVAVVALGGYGRCEMGPFSDIDLMFVHDGGSARACAEVASSVLYTLWDVGIEVGSATRTVDECIAVARADSRTLTSMLDARHVAGDAAPVEMFQQRIAHLFGRRAVRRRFVRQKIAEHEARRRRFGDSMYLLQPNLKEGEGGLREFHMLVWLVRASHPDGALHDMLMSAGLSAESVACLLESVRFIWRARHALHLAEGKRQDRLCDALQEDIARMMGFERDEHSTAAERLMRSYYRHAALVHRLCQWTVENLAASWSPAWKRISRRISRRHVGYGMVRYSPRLMSLDERACVERPLTMLEASNVAKRLGLRLDAGAKMAIARQTPRIDDAFIRCAEAIRLWRGMLAEPVGLGDVLQDMHDCGCLDRWFPELAGTIHRILHDGFHIYTIDVHTVRAVRELSYLATAAGREQNTAVREAFADVAHPHVVSLATLMHDAGKSVRGRHEERGAAHAVDAARRLGFTVQECDETAFLVRSHMLMPTLAFRRDIRDDHLIERFAQTVKTPDILAMLFLVTLADMRAVAPRSWSAWQEGLLGDLYRRTRAALMAAGHTASSHGRDIAERVREVARITGSATGEQSIDSFVSSMPERYAMSTPASVIAEHLALFDRVRAGERSACGVRNDHERGLSELSLITRDEPGLFARIAGALTVSGMNIIDADLYTTNEGCAVDVIRMTGIDHRPVDDSRRWQRAIKQIRRAIEDPTFSTTFERRMTVTSHARRRQRGDPPAVEVDNDVSATETVVEIHACDQPGLLYRIAKTIASCGCSIDRARIATHVDRVIDVFYIRGACGGKITSREQLDELRKALEAEIGQGERSICCGI